MKIIFIVAITLFSLTSCSLQKEIPNNPSVDTNSLYPSPSIVIPNHSEWTKKHYIERIAEFKANPLQFGDIVFIGNSITEQGRNWGQRFNNSTVKNRGIAGDVTAGVINRLAEIYYFKPKKVFIKIGINDLFRDELTPEYVASNIKSIVDKIHLESPKTKIYVQTILPTSKDTPLKQKIQKTNAIIMSDIQSKYCQIIDLHSLFADANDLMISSYSFDGVHLTEEGYILWQNYVKDYVNK
ncbi:GDSL-type esterase/lipase family protein [Flavobacterium sp.]|uniref:GDSL-type esterase/lipase family protein n=1 Tax=Flavobacterium sp. TaxID=239 RepID=UPI00286E24D0|nr:GDSL-type esterase/lipase family protein [Flavobacterium sp.]